MKRRLIPRGFESMIETGSCVGRRPPLVTRPFSSLILPVCRRCAPGIGATCLVLLLCALPPPASSTPEPAATTHVRTLVHARSPIVAFAQGGAQIAWIENADPFQSCGELHVRVVATNREARLPLGSVEYCRDGVSHFA